MNYIILYGCGFVQKENMKSYKLFISSAIGASYAIISYLGINSIYSTIFMKILLSIIMCYVAFTIKSIKKLFKTVLLFYVVSFVTAGLALSLLYLINPSLVSFQNGVLVGTYPIKITVIAGALGFLIIQYSFKVNKRIMKNKELICNLEINVRGKNITTKAFIDSGNNLKDPLTNVPVIIIEKKLIQDIFQNFDLSYENFIKNNTNLKWRLIPFKSIGKQNGMLLGMQADFVRIISNNDKEIELYNITLALYEKKIGNKYSALVGLDLLEQNAKFNNVKVRDENGYNATSKKGVFKFNKL